MVWSTLFRFAWGIMQAEGWKVRGEDPAYVDGTLSYINHNPGNVRSSPFEVANVNNMSTFRNDIEGIFACAWQIWVYASGRSKYVKSTDSIEQAMHVYNSLVIGTPEMDNYLSILEANSGLKRTDPISSVLTG